MTRTVEAYESRDQTDDNFIVWSRLLIHLREILLESVQWLEQLLVLVQLVLVQLLVVLVQLLVVLVLLLPRVVQNQLRTLTLTTRATCL